MPRAGRHPLKNKEIKHQPVIHQKVTITTIVYIPILAGYWQESLKVLYLFFESLYANTDQPFDLMVFDNGSCEEVKNYLLDLQANGKIQYLVFSTQNLKKLGALNYLLSSAPGEYIAYADSDVYFLLGWLDESLKVLGAFPEAGKVTALPIVGGDTTEISKPVLERAQSDPSIKIETGLLVPQEYVDAHRVGLGQSPEAYTSRLLNRKDTVFTRNGISALLSGADFQFVITRQAAQSALPLQVERPEEYFDPIYSPVLEYRLDEAGFWQLSTPGYYVHHMGNKVPDLRKELGRFTNFHFDKEQVASHNNRSYLRRFFIRIIQINLFRRLLKYIYAKSYQLLFIETHENITS